MVDQPLNERRITTLSTLVPGTADNQGQGSASYLIWRTCILLTPLEDAIRDTKSPLLERPIFHHPQNRVHVHIFLCVLAYHLLAAIEHRFL